MLFCIIKHPYDDDQRHKDEHDAKHGVYSAAKQGKDAVSDAEHQGDNSKKDQSQQNNVKQLFGVHNHTPKKLYYSGTSAERIEEK